ncbi:MAG: hypothetical protein VX393_03565, partial [Pseudomonadota bacterium]|nr:hypothetical protein [Pseudomonadota bacterium]
MQGLLQAFCCVQVDITEYRGYRVPEFIPQAVEGYQQLREVEALESFRQIFGNDIHLFRETFQAAPKSVKQLIRVVTLQGLLEGFHQVSGCLCSCLRLVDVLHSRDFGRRGKCGSKLVQGELCVLGANLKLLERGT